ncbi:MAG: alpha/beta hydrolase [Halieaceae bacterium]|jgi:epsilon-lactone hydrolase|nr:alpha/beta hydrolase [Halieaceae bacterium]
MDLLILFILVFIGFSYRYLRGENLAYLDSNLIPQPVGEPSEEHHAVVASLGEFAAAGRGQRGRARLQLIRDYMETMSDDKSFGSEFRPVTQGRLRGEWVLAPGADSRRRLLYIHGGAWMAGSPVSHRAITDKLSVLADAAVFSLDYRLLPEHSRQDGIDDCRAAYQWLLTNGPEGAEVLDFMAVAGDSAGGNLTLSLLAWARDAGLRAADAAIALSPATDASLTSPSLSSNVGSDPMLGPVFGKLTAIPRIFLWWGSWFSTRFRSADPVVSPLRGDLSGLPPVLIQVSEAEMLFDDTRRYVTKAQAAGSPVVMQAWPYMVHVWQIFTPELPEAEEAYANIEEFLVSVEGRSAAVSGE